MTQDTRKDRRAKIVSLNVRYKSATVDEFIDNHSHDVSKGGLFIKTSSPFPPGTLLKFEIRIAGDKAVIAGVGRVVWKREAAQSGPEVPAGMGVKFIKIDDASRLVIDKLVESRGEGSNAYDEGVGESGGQEPPVAAAAAAPAAVGIKPIVPVSAATVASREMKPASVALPSSATPPAQAAPFRPAPSASKIPAAAGKRTMMGIGVVQDTVANAAAKASPGPAAGRPASGDPRVANPAAAVPRVSPAAGAPSASGGSSKAASSGPTTSPMFPKTNSEAEMPPKNEQTVMKQAAELLEEALLGAGGSMEEIGQNPLFDVAKKESAPVTTKDRPAPSAAAKSSSTQDGPPTMLGMGPEALRDLEKPTVEEFQPPRAKEAAEQPAPAEPAPTLASGLRHGALEATARSAGNDEPKVRAAPAKTKETWSDRPPSAAATLADAEEPKNKWLVPVLALAGAGVLGFLLYTQVYAPAETDNPPTPTPPASVSGASSAPAASASAEPSASGAASAASAQPSASAAPTIPEESASAAAPGVDASVPPEAAASAATVAKPVVPVAPWRPPPPKPKPAAPAATESGDKPAPASTEGSSNATPPADTAATATATPSPAPAPKPAPKPKKADDDNPY
jgi:uncharacterized protein (TIGR02266 family)